MNCIYRKEDTTYVWRWVVFETLSSKKVHWVRDTATSYPPKMPRLMSSEQQWDDSLLGSSIDDDPHERSTALPTCPIVTLRYSRYSKSRTLSANTVTILRGTKAGFFESVAVGFDHVWQIYLIKKNFGARVIQSFVSHWAHQNVRY